MESAIILTPLSAIILTPSEPNIPERPKYEKKINTISMHGEKVIQSHVVLRQLLRPLNNLENGSKSTYRRVAEIQIFEKTYLIVIKDETGLKFKINDSTLFLIGSYAQKLVASY